MSFSSNFVLVVTLLSVMSAAHGSCWRYGHSCWGGHGKRSGEPPGWERKKMQILPLFTNSNSQITGDYYNEEGLEQEDPLEQDLTFSQQDEQRPRTSSNLPTIDASRELNRLYPDIVSPNEIVEADLGGGEDVDRNLLASEIDVGPTGFLNRERKGPAETPRRTLVIYRFMTTRR